MSSLFRPHRPEEARSGGKIVRSRRAAAPPLPYARPQSLPLKQVSPSLHFVQSVSSRWFVGLISGAGKLISSVFGSDDSSSSSSSAGYSSDGDIDFCSNEVDVAEFCQEFEESNQGKKLEQPKESLEGSKAIISRSATKLAFEQLLMKETFSRASTMGEAKERSKDVASS